MSNSFHSSTCCSTKKAPGHRTDMPPENMSGHVLICSHWLLQRYTNHTLQQGCQMRCSNAFSLPFFPFFSLSQSSAGIPGRVTGCNFGKMRNTFSKNANLLNKTAQFSLGGMNQHLQKSPKNCWKRPLLVTLNQMIAQLFDARCLVCQHSWVVLWYNTVVAMNSSQPVWCKNMVCVVCDDAMYAVHGT